MSNGDSDTIDFARWLLVFEQPHLTWLGESHVALVVLGEEVILRHACVLQSVDMLRPGPGGQPQQFRNTSITPVHSFTHDVAIHMIVRSYVWMSDLAAPDRKELERMIHMHRQQMQARRMQQLGLVTS